MSLPMTAIETPLPESRIEVASRFGNFNVDQDRVISMPQGLLGFADHQIFALTHPNGDKNSPFKVLQSLRDSEAGFLVLPLPLDNNLIKRSDLEDAASALNIEGDSLAILLVVTIRKDKESGDSCVSVNTQAPVIVDAQRKCAWQAVLEGDYTTRHKI